MVVARAFNPSTREAEAGGSLGLRSAWSTEQVLGQPGLHRETLSPQKTKQKRKKMACVLRQKTSGYPLGTLLVLEQDCDSHWGTLQRVLCIRWWMGLDNHYRLFNNKSSVISRTLF